MGALTDRSEERWDDGFIARSRPKPTGEGPDGDDGDDALVRAVSGAGERRRQGARAPAQPRGSGPADPPGRAAPARRALPHPHPRRQEPRRGLPRARRGGRAARTLHPAHGRRDRRSHREREVHALQRPGLRTDLRDGTAPPDHRRADRLQLVGRGRRTARPAGDPGKAAATAPGDPGGRGAARDGPGGPARPGLGGRRAPRTRRPGPGAGRRGGVGGGPGEVRRRGAARAVPETAGSTTRR